MQSIEPRPLRPGEKTKNNIEIEALPTTRTNKPVIPRENKETAIASSIIPWPYDDNKALYLGYRACGFSFKEALRAIGVGKSSISNWRAEDPDFLRIENDLHNIRKTLAKDFVELEFMRNFRLVLEKDRRIISKSLGHEKDPETGDVAEMQREDQEYLLKMRGQYTVEQMKALENIVGHNSGFNFTDWVQQNADVIGMQRTTSVETVMMRRQEELDNA